ncbi:hypothetical protein L6V77_05940 [Myxococcota bacterium]|nr:hypothetical protein [Myxococcota bacterium]
MTPSLLLFVALSGPPASPVSAPASVPASTPVPESASPLVGYAHLAPLPCPAGAEAPEWHRVATAHREAQLDTRGLPAAFAVRAGLHRALGAAVDALCAGRAPTSPEVDAARHALGGEAPAALADALRGLLALAFERAGRPEEARTLWAELRAGERPSEWLVRALLAGADARAAGDLAFSAQQQFQRAFDLGSPGARCYAAWRLASEAARPAGPDQPPDVAAVDAALAQARTAATADAPVCAWVRARLPGSP